MSQDPPLHSSLATEQDSISKTKRKRKKIKNVCGVKSRRNQAQALSPIPVKVAGLVEVHEELGVQGF